MMHSNFIKVLNENKERLSDSLKGMKYRTEARARVTNIDEGRPSIRLWSFMEIHRRMRNNLFLRYRPVLVGKIGLEFGCLLRPFVVP